MKFVALPNLDKGGRVLVAKPETAWERFVLWLMPGEYHTHHFFQVELKVLDWQLDDRDALPEEVALDKLGLALDALGGTSNGRRDGIRRRQ